jgi:hypothetical protein
MLATGLSARIRLMTRMVAPGGASEAGDHDHKINGPQRRRGPVPAGSITKRVALPGEVGEAVGPDAEYLCDNHKQIENARQDDEPIVLAGMERRVFLASSPSAAASQRDHAGVSREGLVPAPVWRGPVWSSVAWPSAVHSAPVWWRKAVTADSMVG